MWGGAGRVRGCGGGGGDAATAGAVVWLELEVRWLLPSPRLKPHLAAAAGVSDAGARGAEATAATRRSQPKGLLDCSKCWPAGLIGLDLEACPACRAVHPRSTGSLRLSHTYLTKDEKGCRIRPTSDPQECPARRWPRAP
uniref:Uncharacterized protein n=1 Tax=Rhizochromulina marina TaxID=1034831 RepID=A0A7S2SR68_9STRA